MSRNPKAEPIWTVNVVTVWGGKQLYLEEDEAAEFNADPDAGAAKQIGLTKREYLQWLDLEGAPLCGHRAKGGDLCRNLAGKIQLEPKDWKARHRKLRCTAHGGKSAK